MKKKNWLVVYSGPKHGYFYVRMCSVVLRATAEDETSVYWRGDERLAGRLVSRHRHSGPAVREVAGLNAAHKVMGS